MKGYVMDKRKEIRTTRDVVLMLLQERPSTRSSDNQLYFRVCEFINPDVCYASFAEVFNNYEDYGLPSFETVRRTRQKLQEEDISLKACVEVEEFRKENEKIFREEMR